MNKKFRDVADQEIKKIEKKRKIFFVITTNKRQEKKLLEEFGSLFVKEFKHDEIVKEVLKDKDLYAYVRQFVNHKPQKVELCEGCEYETNETIFTLAKTIAEAISGYGMMKAFISSTEMKKICKKVDKERGK